MSAICDAHDRFEGGQWLCWTAPAHTRWDDARSRGFWKLFAAIGRHAQPMTSPVLVRVRDGDDGAQFTIMFKVDAALRPTPADAAEGVSALALPTMRVLSTTLRSFGGYETEATCREAAARLATCRDGPAHEWYAGFYEAPFHFWRRRCVVFLQA